MSDKVTSSQLNRLSRELQTNSKIVEILLPRKIIASQIIQMFRDKFVLERLVEESQKTDGIDLTRINKLIDRTKYDRITWEKILNLLKARE